MADSKLTEDIARRLHAAHVAFELRQWQGETRQRRLTEEVETFWSWAQSTPLNALLDVRTARAAAERLLLEMELPDSLGVAIGDMATAVIELDLNKNIRIREVVDKQLFDDGVTLFIELETLRERCINQVLESPVYAAVMSDVLYQGIRDYLLSDTGALGNIPGISSLIRGSASAVNKRVPGLEAQVEKRVRAFIEANIGKTLARSQVLLLESLDAERIRAIADEVWTQLEDSPLFVADVLAEHETAALAEFGLRAWRELRATDYAEQLLAAGIDAFYERFGDMPLSEVCEHFGMTRELLNREIDALAEPVIDALIATGWLEAFIDRRLARFYRSKTFSDALGGG